MKRVFFLALPDGFVVKVLVANPILLYCVSYHGEKCSNQGARSCPCCARENNWFFFGDIKDRFLSLLWIESGERAMRGAGPSEAPSISHTFDRKIGDFVTTIVVKKGRQLQESH